MFGFNVLDIIAMLVFSFCLVWGVNRGFLRMTFSFVSILVSFYIARALYQPVSAFLKGSTPAYDILKTQIITALGLQEIIENYIQQGETAVLYHLPLPQVVLERLLENNTPSMRIMLGAVTLEDYIGSFLAGIGLNILALLLVFILAIILTNFIARVLRVISKLPIIRSFDRAGGALVGAVIGFLAVWTLVTLYLTLFVGLSQSDGEIFNNSVVGQFLYTRGLLLRGMS